MAYQTQYLDTLVTMAQILVKKGADKDAALTQACEIAAESYLDVIKHRDGLAVTEEKVEENTFALGIVYDVQNGFVSPSIGNVRQYVLDRI